MLFLKNFTQYIKESMTDYSGKRHKVTNTEDIKNFIFAGKAIFTIESQVTGVWYTYKLVKAKKNENLFFVNVLRGPDNESSYTYVGLVIKEGTDLKFTLTKNSKYKFDAPCVVAFSFFFKNIVKNYIHPQMNFYHMGICGRCGKILTVPSSIELGLGPYCAKRSEEEEINLDRKTKLVRMRKEWNQEDVVKNRKIENYKN